MAVGSLRCLPGWAEAAAWCLQSSAWLESWGEHACREGPPAPCVPTPGVSTPGNGFPLLPGWTGSAQWEFSAACVPLPELLGGMAAEGQGGCCLPAV